MENVDEITAVWMEEDLHGLATPTDNNGIVEVEGGQPMQVFKFRDGVLWIK